MDSSSNTNNNNNAALRRRLDAQARWLVSCSSPSSSSSASLQSEVRPWGVAASVSATGTTTTDELAQLLAPDHRELRKTVARVSTELRKGYKFDGSIEEVGFYFIFCGCGCIQSKTEPTTKQRESAFRLAKLLLQEKLISVRDQHYDPTKYCAFSAVSGELSLEDVFNSRRLTNNERTLALGPLSVLTLYSVNVSLFGNTVLRLGTDKHHHLLDAVDQGSIIGS